jgi:acetylglutamate kinase
VKVLIKLGGTLVDSPEVRANVASQIAAAGHRGIAVAVVHGGGKQMTRFLEERGITSRFVNGLRVTTPETMDAVLKVLAGSVNQELVAALNAAGARAVGLTGIDGGLVHAEQMDPQLGLVGRVERTHTELLELLTGNGFLPVVACVAGSRTGQMYNVNADQMASACAAGWRADRLIFLTDIAGVLDASGALQTTLTARDCGQLIREGVATGGMQAKLNAATQAIEEGVEQIEIAPGAQPGILDRLLAGEPMGTRIVRSREGAACHD